MEILHSLTLFMCVLKLGKKIEINIICLYRTGEVDPESTTSGSSGASDSGAPEWGGLTACFSSRAVSSFCLVTLSSSYPYLESAHNVIFHSSSHRIKKRFPHIERILSKCQILRSALKPKLKNFQ